MHNIWLVAYHEFRKRTGQRSFLISTLAFPIFIALIMTISIVTAIASEKSAPLGYVDLAGLLPTLPNLAPLTTEDKVDIVSFADTQSAQAALERGEIQAFYVIPAQYRQNGQIELYFWDKAPNTSTQAYFDDFLRAQFTAHLPGSIQQRIVDGPNIVMRNADGSREFSEERFMDLILPLGTGFLLIFAIMMSSGYMLQVMADEKENRTMEILMTSLTPEQLIAGKGIGLIAVSIAQLILWLVTVAVGLAIASRYVDALQGIQVPWGFLVVVSLFFLPSFALVAGIMTAIGVSVTERNQGQQIAGIINMVFMVPYFLLPLILENPNSPLVVGLTLFPSTAFVMVGLRWAMTVIPTAQLVLSWALLTAAAAFSLLASARIFRAGMLMYGKGLDLRAIVQAIRGG